MNAVTCDSCGAACVPSGITTGYGTTADGKRHCFACCAVLDREAMVRDGRMALYWTDNADGTVTLGNWPGSLAFQTNCHWSSGRKSRWGTRYRAARFLGPDGAVWSVRFADSGNHQIARCRRTKIAWVWA